MPSPMAILVEPKLARELRLIRELRLTLELRLARELRVITRLSREPTAVTVSLRPRPCSVFLGVDSSSRRTTSTAFSSSIIFGCLEAALVAGQIEASINSWNLPLREVFRILVERVVAAEDIDESQDDLVRCVVYIYSNPANTLVAAAEMDLVKDLFWSQLDVRSHISQECVSDLP